MGNSPSVSGPERGGAHVERDITRDDHLAEPRPANHNAGDSNNELADEQSSTPYWKLIGSHILR